MHVKDFKRSCTYARTVILILYYSLLLLLMMRHFVLLLPQAFSHHEDSFYFLRAQTLQDNLMRFQIISLRALCTS